MKRKRITKAIACSLCGVMALTTPIQSMASGASVKITHSADGIDYSDYSPGDTTLPSGYAVENASAAAVQSGTLTIPDEANGKPVYALNRRFMANSGAETVTIGKNIRAFNSDAFLEALSVKGYQVNAENRILKVETGENPVLYRYDGTVLMDYPSAAEKADFKVPDATAVIYSMDNAKFGSLDLNQVNLVAYDSFAGTYVDTLTLRDNLKTKNGSKNVHFSGHGLHAKQFIVAGTKTDDSGAYLKTNGNCLYTDDGELLKLSSDAGISNVDWTKITSVSKDAFDSLQQYQEMYPEIPDNVKAAMKNTVFQFYNQNNSVFMVNGDVGFCFNYDKAVPDSVVNLDLQDGKHGNFSELIGKDKYQKVNAIMFAGVPYDGAGLFKKNFGCSYDEALARLAASDKKDNAALNAVASAIHKTVSGKSIETIQGIGSIDCFTKENVDSYLSDLETAANESEKYTFTPVFELGGESNALTFREQEDGSYLSDEFSVYAYNGNGQKTDAYQIEMTMTGSGFTVVNHAGNVFHTGETIRLNAATKPDTSADAKPVTFSYKQAALDYYDPAQGSDYQHVLVSATNTETASVPYTIVVRPQVETLTLSKKTVSGTEELPGAELTLTNTATNEVTAQWTSGSTPKTIEMPADGTYRFTEVTAPNGYQKAESIDFTIEGGKVIGIWTDNTVIMYDAPVPKTVTISKKDATTSDELPGAELTITKDGTTVETWTSTTTPHVIENMPDGTYTLTEVTSPDGYQKAESITFTVKDGIVENGPVTMYDNPVSVKISKQDITTHAELPGAKLTVSNKATGQVVETWISTDTLHEITGLKDGVYELTEITAPSGYEIAEAVTFTVRDRVVSNETVVMYDKPSETIPNTVKISKRDATTGEELPGAKLTVTDESGEVKDSWTSTDTPHEIENLTDGNYTLTEVTAPDGYEVAESVVFTVKDGAVIGNIVIMLDQPTGDTPTPPTPDKDHSFVISKRDITNGKELAGAELTLTDEDGEEIDSWVSTKTPHEIKNLPDGEYTLTEVTAPDGYEVAESITFTVENGTITGGSVVMYDTPTKATPSEPEEKQDFTISKRDITTGKELPGAKLTLTDSDDSIVETWISGSKPHQIKNLADGEYTLTEVTAPDGYEVAESITFTVENGTVKGGSIVMYDTPIKATPSEPEEDEDTYFYISKRDAATSAELPGAQLKLTNQDGDIIATWTSTSSPKKIENPEDGVYTLTETTAPNGYLVAESITFTVENGTVKGGTVVMLDQKKASGGGGGGSHSGGGGGGHSHRVVNGGSGGPGAVQETPVTTGTTETVTQTPVETTQPTPTPSELPKTDDISAFSLSFWAAAIVMLGLLADEKRKRANIR